MGAFTEKTFQLDFLLRRKNSKPLVVKVLKSLIEKKTNISLMAKLFDQINTVCAAIAQEGGFGSLFALQLMLRILSTLFLRSGSFPGYHPQLKRRTNGRGIPIS